MKIKKGKSYLCIKNCSNHFIKGRNYEAIEDNTFINEHGFRSGLIEWVKNFEEVKPDNGMKKAIAMRCTQKQFEAIKPKLEKMEQEIDAFGSFPYLTNFLRGIENNIGNIFESCKGDYKREVFETWNEKVFLEACGISTVPTLEEVKEYFKDCKFFRCVSSGKVIDFTQELRQGVHYWNEGYWIDLIISNAKIWDSKGGYAEILTYKEKNYSLTKEQLRSITDPKVKEWFPEVFKTVLEVGKWYSSDYVNEDGVKSKFTVFIEDVKKFKNYGIDFNGKWMVNMWWSTSEDVREATESEVFEALKNEAVKRGFVEGVYISETGINEGFKGVLRSSINGYFTYHNSQNILDSDNGFGYIFHAGQWAEIIPTITKAEAEKELNKKIVD